MKISKNFTLEELCVTSQKMDNTPTKEAVVALRELVENVLQPARDILGSAITVNSGYRSPVVNKAIGGAATSQHMKGEAADIRCADNKKLFEIIRNNFVFDQLIHEFGDDKQPQWVHVSYKTQGNRNEILRAVKENGKTKYLRL